MTKQGSGEIGREIAKARPRCRRMGRAQRNPSPPCFREDARWVSLRSIQSYDCMFENCDAASYSVIASAAKQSRIPPRKDSGLLRCARNDEEDSVRAMLRSRAPDAGQRVAVRCRAGAHLSAPCRAALDPGSAPQR
nr:hypothetical protein BDOA9_0127840 [Bradyrhizobium sp. DOA9]